MQATCDCGHAWEYEEKDIKSHRVMCGDATKIEDVEKLMDGQKADMVFTDPPYGMNLDVDFSGMKSSLFKGKTGGNYYEKVIGDDKQFNQQEFAWIECKEQFWWGADYYADTLPKGGSFFVWDKRLTDSAGDMWGSEFELLWSKTPHKREIIRIKWAGILGMQTQDTKSRVHPTQKPIELCAEFIKRFSQDENIILDLFGGSGSTLIACEQSNRICYTMELDPKYCDVIRKRYQNFIENRKETTNG